MMPAVPPPFVVQQRASDCAFVLRTEWCDCMALAERVAVEVVARMHPEQLGWAECGDMFRLYGAVVTVRV
jgi:hypothetical protein